MLDSSAEASEFERAARHVILDYPEYRFEIDEHRRGSDQLLQAHLRIFRFTPSVLKRIRREWKLFRTCVTAPLIAWGEDDDEKWEHFVTSLGFKPLGQDVVCNNGACRRIFIHLVEDKPDERLHRTAAADHSE